MGRRSRSVKTKTEFPWSGKLESFWQTIILHGMLLTEFVPIHMERIKSLETIKFEDLKNNRVGENDPSALRNISYLKMIGSLDTDEDILEDLLGEQSGEEDSDSLDSWDK